MRSPSRAEPLRRSCSKRSPASMPRGGGCSPHPGASSPTTSRRSTWVRAWPEASCPASPSMPSPSGPYSSFIAGFADLIARARSAPPGRAVSTPGGRRRRGGRRARSLQRGEAARRARRRARGDAARPRRGNPSGRRACAGSAGGGRAAAAQHPPGARRRGRGAREGGRAPARGRAARGRRGDLVARTCGTCLSARIGPACRRGRLRARPPHAPGRGQRPPLRGRRLREPVRDAEGRRLRRARRADPGRESAPADRRTPSARLSTAARVPVTLELRRRDGGRRLARDRLRGRWAMRLKDRIDRRFVERYR